MRLLRALILAGASVIDLFQPKPAAGSTDVSMTLILLLLAISILP